MQNGTKKKPNLGFKGTSSMCLLDNFCVTTGIVPDYMHCVLLGVTKTLLQKWFSPSQSKKTSPRQQKLITAKLQVLPD